MVPTMRGGTRQAGYKPALDESSRSKASYLSSLLPSGDGYNGIETLTR